MNFFGRLLLSLLGGALYSLPFMERSLSLVAFIGLAPALLVLAHPRGSLWGKLGWSYVIAWVGTVLVSIYVVRIAPSAVFIDGVSTQLWVWGALFAFACLRRWTGWPVALLWPCCWIIAEWGWSFYSLGARAQGLSGYTLFLYPRLIQIADVGGVLLVSFMIQAVVGGVTDVVLAWWAPSPRRSWRVLLTPLLSACGFVGLAAIYGTIRLSGAQLEWGPRLALIQPSIEHSLDEATVLMVQAKQVGLARKHVRPGEVDLVVFPENAVMKYIEGSPYLEQFQDLSRELRAPILAGVTTRTEENLRRWKAGEPALGIRLGQTTYRYGHNSAAVITPEGMLDKYDKRHLLPFSEELPLEPFFEWLGLLGNYRLFVESTLGYIGTGVPGKETRLLSVPGTNHPPYWTPICFEQADARLSREASRKGARYFINITSEGDLGPQIYWMTMAVCALRAAELHVGIARAGNNGITSTFDPWGRVLRIYRGERGSPWGEPGVLKARVPLGPPGTTLYARLGDWPVGLSTIVLAAALLVGGVRRARRSRSG